MKQAIKTEYIKSEHDNKRKVRQQMEIEQNQDEIK